MRSARGIERRCREDVAFRVICANQVPDHATIARFRARHEEAIADLFGGVLELCAKAGLVRVGIVAVDGTKVAAAATHLIEVLALVQDGVDPEPAQQDIIPVGDRARLLWSRQRRAPCADFRARCLLPFSGTQVR